MCPHCCRELHAAPPRLVSIGLPVFLSLFALAVLASRWQGGNPITWALSGIGSLGGQVVRFDEIEPNVVMVMTPVAPSAEEAVAQQEQQAADLAVADAAPTADRFSDAKPSSPPELQAALESTLPAQGVVLVPTDTPVQAETQAVASTEVPGAAAALQPTATPTPLPPTPTATETPTQPPTATVTPEPTEVATEVATEVVAEAAAVAPVTHRIRPGETLLGIAQQYGVDVDDLMAINNIAPSQVFVIQPGQTLVIPSDDFVPEPASTDRPAATAPPPTPTTASVETAIRLDAPILRSPENGTPVSCGSQDTLLWLGVPFIKADDKYLLHLGFVSGRTADNQEIITWVLEQPRPANLTSWDLGSGLCGLAPQAFGRQWRWWVEVVEDRGGELVPVSRPSAMWNFSWN